VTGVSVSAADVVGRGSFASLASCNALDLNHAITDCIVGHHQRVHPFPTSRHLQLISVATHSALKTSNCHSFACSISPNSQLDPYTPPAHIRTPLYITTHHRHQPTKLAPNIPDLFSPKAHRRRRASFPNINGASTNEDDNGEPLYTASQIQSLLDWREKQHSSSNSNLPSVPQLVSIVVVFLVLVAQFLIPWVQEQHSKSEDIRRARFEAVCPWSPFEDHWICASDLAEAQSPSSKKTSRNTFEKLVVRNMALASAAEKVVAEFDYSGDEIRKGVKEFLKEMGGFYPSSVLGHS
jgi:hypothetical protein